MLNFGCKSQMGVITPLTTSAFRKIKILGCEHNKIRLKIIYTAILQYNRKKLFSKFKVNKAYLYTHLIILCFTDVDQNFGCRIVHPNVSQDGCPIIGYLNLT